MRHVLYSNEEECSLMKSTDNFICAIDVSISRETDCNIFDRNTTSLLKNATSGLFFKNKLLQILFGLSAFHMMRQKSTVIRIETFSFLGFCHNRICSQATMNEVD
jgi:hypothetical protein